MQPRDELQKALLTSLPPRANPWRHVQSERQRCLFLNKYSLPSQEGGLSFPAGWELPRGQGTRAPPIRLGAPKGSLKSWLTSFPTQVTLLALRRDPVHSPKNLHLNLPPPPTLPSSQPGPHQLDANRSSWSWWLAGSHPQGEEADKHAGSQ